MSMFHNPDEGYDDDDKPGPHEWFWGTVVPIAWLVVALALSLWH